jgi:hypothetical protein
MLGIRGFGSGEYVICTYSAIMLDTQHSTALYIESRTEREATRCGCQAQ